MSDPTVPAAGSAAEATPEIDAESNNEQTSTLNITSPLDLATAAFTRPDQMRHFASSAAPDIGNRIERPAVPLIAFPCSGAP